MMKEKDNKEDCPLCQVSEDTIKKLRENKPKEKLSLKLKIIILIIIIAVFAFGGFVLYKAFGGSLEGAKIEEAISSALFKNLEVGDSAPDFSSEDVFGNQISSNDFKNKSPVLLVFWATWCGYCARELPSLMAFAQDHENEIKVIAIASGEEKETIKRYIQEKNVNFSILLDIDRKIWNKYLIRGTPSHFLINTGGKIVALRPGLASREDLEIMTSMLTELW